MALARQVLAELERRSRVQAALPKVLEPGSAQVQERPLPLERAQVRRALQPQEPAQAQPQVLRQQEREQQLTVPEARAELQGASARRGRPRLLHPCPLWPQIQRQLPPEPVPEYFCGLLPRRPRESNWSASSFQ
jgi:hypothetical protein